MRDVVSFYRLFYFISVSLKSDKRGGIMYMTFMYINCMLNKVSNKLNSNTKQLN